VLGARRTPCNSFKPDWSGYQEAQLSQRDCAMLRVIEYFAESLRSFEMTLLSRARVSPYWYFIETMSVCRNVYEIFSVKEWRNLETGGRGRSRSAKMAPFDRSYTTF